MPVAKLLGKLRWFSIFYANIAHHPPPEELARRASEYVAAGHNALRVRGLATFMSLAEATDRSRNVRNAISADVRLIVDVIGTWDVGTAIQQPKARVSYDLHWLEEPVPPHDMTGYTRIRERYGSTNIVGGEQSVQLIEFETLISAGFDIMQPKRPGRWRDHSLACTPCPCDIPFGTRGALEPAARPPAHGSRSPKRSMDRILHVGQRAFGLPTRVICQQDAVSHPR